MTPPWPACSGCETLGAKRISILTPYTVETSRPMAAYFAGHGFDIAASPASGLRTTARWRGSAGRIVDLARQAMAPDAEALFISCTALRAALAAPAIERAIGRPVVTSNLATAWDCLRLCGDDAPRPNSDG